MQEAEHWVTLVLGADVGIGVDLYRTYLTILLHHV